MPDWLARIAVAAWEVTLAAAPFTLFGLLMAGLLYVYLPASLVRRAMGGSGLGSVVRAAAIGAPLPLCSCGVIPVALYLRKEGASRGAVQSFLISTPETGVDSISITYALMGPFMAVVRPVAAVVTAVAAGLGERLFGAPEEPAPAAPAPDGGCPSCPGRPDALLSRRQAGLPGALKYSFVVLARDLAPWLLLGLALSGVVSGLVPEGFFEKHLGRGILPVLLMVLLSTPMYMCAAGATPLAAALMQAGMGPGAALAFLLAGPATNVATMTTVGKFLGRRSLVIYLATIMGLSLFFGWALDVLVPAEWARKAAAGAHQHGVLPEWLSFGCAALLLLVMANGLRLRLVPYWMAWRDRADKSSQPPAPPGKHCHHCQER